MSLPSEDIAQFINDNDVLTLGSNLFIEKLPDSAINAACVYCVDTTINDYIINSADVIEDYALIISVKGIDLITTRTIAYELFELLKLKSNIVINQYNYLIYAVSTPLVQQYDTNKNVIMQINLMIRRTKQ